MWRGVALRMICRVPRPAKVGEEGVELARDSLERLMRLMSIWVVNRAPALIAVAPVLEGVDVGDMGLRGQTLEQGVIAILAVGVECGELVGGVGFIVQQEGERHRDSRLYWGSGDEQCSQESAGVRGESEGFYGGP
jgi:hypothetical protein